ncbi:methyltransferase [Streptomyces thermodiastaticus]|nr:class I SAM-dependent methyltransferase [Streptomyces thermodiastaticus]MCE7552105.1 methyltransferase domain-containing protein [Streptomyces thermodiastaticus]GHF82194.1 methyltransferase [Streptomyces thermodiastaticus]
MTDRDAGSQAAAVFDALRIRYEQAFAHSAAHRASLEWLSAHLGPHSRVLDVGSGTGRPTAATLAAAGHEVLGVDVSPVMAELAARQVPQASFRCADIRDLPLAEGSFDAVCVYFALLQMSRRDQEAVVRRLVRAVRPSGIVVLATVPLDVEMADGIFLGQPVRVTSFDEEGFVRMATAAGLTVLSRQTHLFTPAAPGATPEPHLFLHCRRTTG